MLNRIRKPLPQCRVQRILPPHIGSLFFIIYDLWFWISSFLVRSKKFCCCGDNRTAMSDCRNGTGKKSLGRFDIDCALMKESLISSHDSSPCQLWRNSNHSSMTLIFSTFVCRHFFSNRAFFCCVFQRFWPNPIDLSPFIQVSGQGVKPCAL